MQARENVEGVKARWAKLTVLQQHYHQFIPFLQDVMEELGFSTTEIQEDIAGYIEHGPQYLMIQAQRGQAKTTIAAAFVVWCLIHSPGYRALILSAGGTQATEISTLIVRIVMTMDVLECMRPDKLAGDRTSVEAFDVHHSLKGLDKSPSVASVGIDSNLQGKRADILLADDIESTKNSATPVQRAKLLHLTKDFTSINSTGRILWLGTPQTMESIYNSLPARGVEIRVWPGRYPTQEQIDHYGKHLAPLLARRILADPSLQTGGGAMGDQGQPIDTLLLDETTLQKKERDQGTAYFQLQHMLNTQLTDAMRFPLKSELLIIVRGSGTTYPMSITRGMTNSTLEDFTVGDFAFKVQQPHEISAETSRFQKTVMYVDPAAGGANGDETAYSGGGFLNGNVFVIAGGGLPGGYELLKLEELAKRIALAKPDRVIIEKNMGFGAFREVFTPVLRRFHACEITDDLVSGQKERRIINTLSPIMGRGALIIDRAVIEEDARTIARYSPQLRQSYSLFYQLAKMTDVRDALLHDDRADALEGMCRSFQEALAIDQAKAVESMQKREWEQKMKDPLQHNRFNNHGGSGRSASMLRRRSR